MFAAKSDFTPAQRAHVRRTSSLLLVYALILPPLIWIRANTAVTGFVPLAMAIVAALPVLGIFASWGRYLSDERDEYDQALTLRRIAVATNATMGAAVVWGFLQAFGAMPLVEGLLDPARLGGDPGVSGLHRRFLAVGTARRPLNLTSAFSRIHRGALTWFGHLHGNATIGALSG